MGFMFLFFAVLLNAVKSYCSKRISGHTETLSDTVDVTLVRNMLCAVLGAVFVLFFGQGSFVLPARGWLICLVAGVSIGVNYVVWVLSLKTEVYLFVSAANSASFLVAVLCGMMFFSETLTARKGIAILLILLAMVFMVRYQTDMRGKPTLKHLLLLFSVFLTAGLSSVTQKWFTKTLPDVSAHTYTFYSLLISAVFLLALSPFLSDKKPMRSRIKTQKTMLPWVAIAAACFYGVTYFQTGASALLDAVVMYPMYNGLLLAAGSIMAWLCFSEKPNRNSIIGVFLVFVAVVLSKG